MRQFLIVLFLLALFLGSCAVITRTLQPTIDASAQTWVAAETRTDPIDDLIRFREAERRGRSASLLLPFLLLSTIALLAVVLLTPLPHLLKALRRRPRKRRHTHPAPGLPPPPSPPLTSGWIESPSGRPSVPTLPSLLPEQPPLPPSRSTGWLENE
ncbi:MAG: hypothetical protein KJ069_22975 [Anaerolineae bacterium]|nr:hypothetical protein [Anaerolineae bacterium]